MAIHTKAIAFTPFSFLSFVFRISLMVGGIMLHHDVHPMLTWIYLDLLIPILYYLKSLKV